MIALEARARTGVRGHEAAAVDVGTSAQHHLHSLLRGRGVVVVEVDVRVSVAVAAFGSG